MVIRYLLLGVFALMAMVTLAHASLIPWRFVYGKRWHPIPFKMAFPALAAMMTVMAMGSALGAAAVFVGSGALPAGRAVAVGVAAAGLVAAGAHLLYIRRTAAGHRGFERAFGPNWQDKLPATPGMLQRRWALWPFPVGSARVQRDVAIWTLPDGRSLLADLWQPAQGAPPSGVAFLFFHGSAWHFSDKGVGTDPMFGHLAAQGHVVLDVAYRLAPETDLFGMVADVKRAVAWVRGNARQLGIDPERIVVGGASAGGHISLLAAYGGEHPAFCPPDLMGVRTDVAGVVSLYGPCDLREYLGHHAGRLSITGKPATEKAPLRLDAMSGEQMMMNLLGGMAEDVPEQFDLAAATTHIRAGGPPALIVQGEADFITPADATRRMVEQLRQAQIPVVYLEFPWTEHAWDIGTAMANMVFGRRLYPKFLDSQYAPPSTATLYDLERFLALLAA